MLNIIRATALIIAALYWIAADKIALAFGWRTKDNCFTWAFRNWDYSSGQGFVIEKSRSAWFPHISLFVKYDQGGKRIEYVPNDRQALVSPPSKFDGHIKTTRYVLHASHIKPFVSR